MRTRFLALALAAASVALAAPASAQVDLIIQGAATILGTHGVTVDDDAATGMKPANRPALQIVFDNPSSTLPATIRTVAVWPNGLAEKVFASAIASRYQVLGSPESLKAALAAAGITRDLDHIKPVEVLPGFAALCKASGADAIMAAVTTSSMHSDFDTYQCAAQSIALRDSAQFVGYSPAMSTDQVEQVAGQQWAARVLQAAGSLQRQANAN